MKKSTNNIWVNVPLWGKYNIRRPLRPKRTIVIVKISWDASLAIENVLKVCL